MYNPPDPALIALERHAETAIPFLTAILAELRRANQQREAFASDVYELLRELKETADEDAG